MFAAFEQTGSAYGVVGVFKGRRFPKRAYGGAWAGEVRWGELTHPRVLAVLANPCYAGAYVFGRYRSRRAVRRDGTITTTVTELPGERATACGQRHARRSAPGARRRGAVPGDRALRLLRQTDVHALPGQNATLPMAYLDFRSDSVCSRVDGWVSGPAC